ncbi:RsmB/NOP family class I SAM-dependent RNA methyltransferase [Parvularcula sp. LCG005]|uniref:RsmB/NOP family class I SAM-dependent RNA methyltransferase n=1 Tax=Parvularcula sp. LCG005 TaxID=3078805 RepID=UPI002941ED45|nr:transcription antitermination factor NusB [Parvularcula sp. LCG005]WOI53003.1 transcription antitermination factor NusB [Parvularcula sp. LCG005]
MSVPPHDQKKQFDRPKGPKDRNDREDRGRRGDRDDKNKPMDQRDERREMPKRKRPGVPARGAALDLLRLVRNGRSLDDALTFGRTFNELEGADRAFARNMATTVLRRQGSLDAVLDTYLNQPLRPKQDDLRALLRLTAAQVLLLDIPPHAAASTAVDLARERSETAGYAKLVNAIARRLSETGKERLEKVDVRADMPGWIWRRLERSYGPQKARAIALAYRQEPPLDMTIAPGIDPDVLAERLEAHKVGPRTLRRHGAGRIEDLPGFDEGTWWVQDLAASLPARLAGDLTGKTVFDLCAAPGGKTLQLAAAGGKVMAVDISPMRTERLEENLKRTGLEAKIVVADIMIMDPPERADVILLDAPCTATGTVRRNPDLLWSKREEEVGTLAALQDRMIDQALGWLKPGGTLIFATCSLFPDEGEKRVDAALARHEGLRREPATPEEVGDLPVITKDGDIRCLPSYLSEQGGMDGFFAARLVKG